MIIKSLCKKLANTLLIATACLAGSASASIVYTDLSESPLVMRDVSFIGSSEYSIDFYSSFISLSFDVYYDTSSGDIFYRDSSSYSSIQVYGGATTSPLIVGSVIDINSPFNYDPLLASVSTGTYQRCSGWFGNICTTETSESVAGDYLGQTDVYMGVSLRDIYTQEDHYGWILLDVIRTYDTLHAEIYGYAFETDANTAIIAGDTMSVSAVPLPSAMLLMLSGIIPLLISRRKSRS